MRNPNGYGGISFMGKNRRNPYRVRITTGWDINPETGRAKQQYATLGYYPSRRAAMMALADYNKDPYDLDAGKVTFAEAYGIWAKSNLSEKGQASQMQYNAAYKKCADLYSMKMQDIKKKHLQDVMDKYADQSETAQINIKMVFKAAFETCMENDIVDKDYSKFVKIKQKDANKIHKPFTAEEVATLWQHIDTPVGISLGKYERVNIYPVDTVLMLIYTGMRPSELLNMKCENVNLAEHYMIGGSKTDAGRSRIIPLHDDIMPLVEKRMAAGNNFLIPYKVDRAPKLGQYREYMFNEVMDIVGMEHLPHDGRHTFATFAERYEINKLAVKLIMGHTVSDITDGVYTHKTAADLVQEVNKIIFYEK